jgi:hypothetical protein
VTYDDDDNDDDDDDIHSQSLQIYVPMTTIFLVYEDDHGSALTEDFLSKLNEAWLSTPYCI